MTVDEIHRASVELEREIIELAPASPELAAVVTRIRELQDELERARSTLGPLVPDAASPPSAEESRARALGGGLADLLRAATSKQDA